MKLYYSKIGDALNRTKIFFEILTTIKTSFKAAIWKKKKNEWF